MDISVCTKLVDRPTDWHCQKCQWVQMSPSTRTIAVFSVTIKIVIIAGKLVKNSQLYFLYDPLYPSPLRAEFVGNCEFHLRRRRWSFSSLTRSLSTQLTTNWALRAQRPQWKWQSRLFAPSSKCHDEVQPLERASTDPFSKYFKRGSPLSWNLDLEALCQHRPVIIYVKLILHTVYFHCPNLWCT